MVFFFFLTKIPSESASPSVRLCGFNPKDVDLFRLACVRKQEAKEEADIEDIGVLQQHPEIRFRVF